MEHDEGLGGFGWAMLLLVLVQVVLALIFGFTATFWISLVLAFVVLGILAVLCAGGGMSPSGR